MEIHRPKATHNLREFLSEVAIVVVGIVIALAAEQVVQSFEWRHKMSLADEQMRNEIAGDDGPQVYERLALSPCVIEGLGGIRNAVEHDAARSTLLDALDRVWTPRHTWDSTAFQAATAAGVLSRMPVERVDAMSRFYTLMPALEEANAQELRDSAALFLSRAGGVLKELENERVLGAVEVLRRDNAEIVRLAELAAGAMSQLGIRVADYRQPTGPTSVLQEPGRVVTELQNHPMAQRCVAELEKSVPHK